jgi:hypothetical protein
VGGRPTTVRRPSTSVGAGSPAAPRTSTSVGGRSTVVRGSSTAVRRELNVVPWQAIVVAGSDRHRASSIRLPGARAPPGLPRRLCRAAEACGRGGDRQRIR